MTGRKWWIAALTFAVVLAIVVLVFQPQKLVIDKTVDEAAPRVAAPASPVAPILSAAPDPAAAPAPEPAASSSASVLPTATSSAAPSSRPDPTPSQVAASVAVARPSAGAVPPSSRVARAAAPARSGEFRSLEHPGSGRARLLTAAGGYVVRLEDLAVENGPDLHVYFSAASADSKASAFDDDFISLGRLKGNKGNQNYAVPAGADVARYRSVVVWCKRFGVGFAVAPLTPLA